MNMEFVRRLAIPMEVKEMYPLSAGMEATFQQRDIKIKKILSGQDDRLLLIIGPCSADRQDSVLEYMDRLRGLQEKVSERCGFPVKALNDANAAAYGEYVAGAA